MTYEDNKSEDPKFEFKVFTNVIVDVRDMTETCESQIRKIRRVDGDHIRTRKENSDRAQVVFESEKRDKNNNIDKISF